MNKPAASPVYAELLTALEPVLRPVVFATTTTTTLERPQTTESPRRHALAIVRAASAS